MLHLTNPCAKQKVLSLTKPKGKIYKTKSLRNYITKIPVINLITEFNTGKENMYTKMKYAGRLSSEIARSIELESNYVFGKCSRELSTYDV